MFQNTICEVYKLCDQVQPLLPVLPKKSAHISQLEDLYLPFFIWDRLLKVGKGQSIQFLRRAETSSPQEASTKLLSP